MIDPRYSEDEQAERLKEWWKKNGASVIVGAVIGIGSIVGVNYWRDYTRNRAETASSLYVQLLGAEREALDELGSELMQGYESTPYAALAALYLAKTGYEAGDMETAEAMLKWALEHATQRSTEHAARLRLARLYLDIDRVAEAERLIAVENYEGFESQYKEMAGDIAMLKGDPAKARAAYEEALTSLPQGSQYSNLLALKLDHAAGSAGQ